MPEKEKPAAAPETLSDEQLAGLALLGDAAPLDKLTDDELRRFVRVTTRLQSGEGAGVRRAATRRRGRLQVLEDAEKKAGIDVFAAATERGFTTAGTAPGRLALGAPRFNAPAARALGAKIVETAEKTPRALLDLPVATFEALRAIDVGGSDPEPEQRVPGVFVREPTMAERARETIEEVRAAAPKSAREALRRLARAPETAFEADKARIGDLLEMAESSLRSLHTGTSAVRRALTPGTAENAVGGAVGSAILDEYRKFLTEPVDLARDEPGAFLGILALDVLPAAALARRSLLARKLASAADDAAALRAAGEHAASHPEDAGAVARALDGAADSLSDDARRAAEVGEPDVAAELRGRREALETKRDEILERAGRSAQDDADALREFNLDAAVAVGSGNLIDPARFSEEQLRVFERGGLIEIDQSTGAIDLTQRGRELRGQILRDAAADIVRPVEPETPEAAKWAVGQRVELRAKGQRVWVRDVHVADDGTVSYLVHKNRARNGKHGKPKLVPESEMRDIDPEKFSGRKLHREPPDNPKTKPRELALYIASNGGLARSDEALQAAENYVGARGGKIPGLVRRDAPPGGEGGWDDWGETLRELYPHVFVDRDEAADWLRNTWAGGLEDTDLGRATLSDIEDAADWLMNQGGFSTREEAIKAVRETIRGAEAAGIDDWRGALGMGAALPSLTGGFVDLTMLKALSGSTLGATIGAVASRVGWDDENSEFVVRGLSVGPALVGAGLGGLFGHALFTSSKFRAALANAMSIRRAGKQVAVDEIGDLERVFEELLAPLIPDRFFATPGAAATTAARALLTGVGATVGGRTLEGEVSPGGAILGGLFGFGLGAASIGNLAKMFPSGINPRKAYRMIFTERRGLPDAVFRYRRRMLDRHAGRVSEIQDVSSLLMRAVRDDPEIGNILDRALREQIPFTAIKDEKLRDAAVTLRHLFDEAGVDLIDVGLAEGAVAQTIVDNLGTYLPRLYLHWEKQDNIGIVEQYLRRIGEPLTRLSDRNYLKKRGDVPEAVRRAWGELSAEFDRGNPGLLGIKRLPVTAADIEFARYAKRIASSSEWVIPQSVVREARRGASGQSRFFGEGLPTFSTEGGREIADYAGRRYVKLGSSPKLGVLKNRWVEEAIALDLETFIETPGALRRAFNHALAFFKKSKVTYNPATLMRNVYGNMILADLGGLSPARMDLYGRSFRNYFTGNERYREARRAGLFGGEYLGGEVRELMDAATASGEKTAIGFLAAVERVAKMPLRKAERFHEASEQAWKMAMYDHARDTLKLSEPEAVRYAKKYIFDYREIPRWVQTVRTSPFGAPFITFCVSDDTEILTQNGWKTCYELREQDAVLSLNRATGLSEWKPVTSIYRGTYDGPMLHYSDRHLDMLMTPDHRCVVETRRRVPGMRSQNQTEWSGPHIKEGLECSSRDRIPVAAACSSLPVHETYTDDVVRLVGWFVTEGHWRKYKGRNRYASLSQCRTEHVAEIRGLLTRLGGHFSERRDALAGGGAAVPRHLFRYTWNLREPLSATLRFLCPDKHLHFSFANALTLRQLGVLIETMMKGDGSRDQFIQNDGPTIEAFRYACILAGRSTGYSRTASRVAASITIRKGRAYSLRRTRANTVAYEGVVWCPEVSCNHTWLARRNGKVFFTGNSYKALPRVLESAIAVGDPRKAWRFWKYPVAVGAVNEWSARKAGVVPDEQRGVLPTLRRVAANGLGFGDIGGLKRLLPDYTGAQQMMLPARDQLGRLRFVDLTWMLPWGDIGEIGKGQIGGALSKMGIQFPRQLEPANPMLQVTAAMMTGGMDPFTGREIIPAFQDPANGMIDGMTYVARQFMPTLTPRAGFSAVKLEKSFRGEFASRPDIPAPWEAVLSELLGWKARPVDPTQSLGFKSFDIQKRLREGNSRVRKIARELPASTWPAVQAYLRGVGELSAVPKAQRGRAKTMRRVLFAMREAAEEFERKFRRFKPESLPPQLRRSPELEAALKGDE